MSSTDYNYDEQGQFFPFFILTVTAPVTLLLTYNVLRSDSGLENTAPKIQSEYKPKDADLIEAQRRKQKRKELKLKRIVAAAIGWLTMAYMIYLMLVTQRSSAKIWNPYDILNLPMSASEQDVKSKYRKMSRTQHPDKRQPDPSKNLTAEIINDEWVEVTKAFKALTDEEIRNNYLQYGHPDGKQSFSIGIALPQFIVQEGSGRYVLLAYAALLGVILPYFVGKWWYGQQRLQKEKVLVTSAGNLFREYDNDAAEGGVLNVLSSGEEFKELFEGEKAKTGASTVEKAVMIEADPVTLSTKDRTKIEGLEDPIRRKVILLLWAYMGRLELSDPSLNEEKYEVAPIALALNEAYTSIALAYGNTQPVLSAYRISQHLIQAMPPDSSPLFQLPHFTSAVIKAVEGEGARKHMTVQEFMKLPNDLRQKLAVGPGLLTADQYKVATQVASQIPHLHVEKAFFKVVGERFVTPGSLVQLVVKARVLPPGFSNLVEVDEEDLKDVDPVEGDLDALHGRKRKGEKGGDEPVQPPLAHAPFFARDHSPRWHVFLADAKQGKIAVPPFTFTAFNKPIFDESGNPTFNVVDLKCQFGAPPQAGKYTFVMHLVCDSYVGMDTKMDVTLAVEDPSKAEDMADEDNISEPDEDTVAGQMAALKGGATAPKGKADDESDYESDTEGEDNDDDDSDTDTDTDSDED